MAESTSSDSRGHNQNGHDDDDQRRDRASYRAGRSHNHPQGDSEEGVGSPAHLSSLHGGLLPEDIHELLGGVLDYHMPTDGHEDAAQHHPQLHPPQKLPAGDACGMPNDTKAAARSERKRSREKQRRSDVNKQFATLTDLLRQIESAHTELFASPVWTETSFSPTNRVELMARTIHVLQTLQESHKRQKTRMQELEKEVEQARKAGEEAAAKAKERMMAPMQTGQNQVVMMVPMLIGGPGNPPVGGGHQQANGGSGVASAASQAAMAFLPTQAQAGHGEAGTLGMGAGMMPAGMSTNSGVMPWMMPHAMTPWGMPMPGMAAPHHATNSTPIGSNGTGMPGSSSGSQSTATPPVEEEAKQASSSSGQTNSNNLAHCA